MDKKFIINKMLQFVSMVEEKYYRMIHNIPIPCLFDENVNTFFIESKKIKDMFDNISPYNQPGFRIFNLHHKGIDIKSFIKFFHVTINDELVNINKITFDELYKLLIIDLKKIIFSLYTDFLGFLSNYESIGNIYNCEPIHIFYKSLYKELDIINCPLIFESLIDL